MVEEHHCRTGGIRRAGPADALPPVERQDLELPSDRLQRRPGLGDRRAVPGSGLGIGVGFGSVVIVMLKVLL